MNLTTNYDRGNLTVVHPQLNYVKITQNLGEFKAGRKRFDTNKNIETSGHIASYGSPPPKATKFIESSAESSTVIQNIQYKPVAK